MTTPEEYQQRILSCIVKWAEPQEAIRAVVQTSSRTNPNAPVDAFSDFDIILFLTDIHPFYHHQEWLEDFGRVLAIYADPIHPDPRYGLELTAWITQYEDGLKIDWSLFPVAMLPRIQAAARRTGHLDPDMDNGYEVLLDKDGLTEGLPAPTYSGYIPSPPTQAEYQKVIMEFFHEATYAVKHFWRGDLLPAKYNFDYAMKHQNLRKMLDWRMEIDHGWAVKTGAYGKGLKKKLDPRTWAELEATYAGAGMEENWLAFYRTITLFRRVAKEVADSLGFQYPTDLDQRCVAYFEKVQHLDRSAAVFPGAGEPCAER